MSIYNLYFYKLVDIFSKNGYKLEDKIKKVEGKTYKFETRLKSTYIKCDLIRDLLKDPFFVVFFTNEKLYISINPDIIEIMESR